MKKLFCIPIAIILLFIILPVYTSAINPADALYRLGLFRGTDKGYELDKTLTRAEAVTMIVRFLGAEEEAENTPYTAPFTDVQEWAKPYVNYAYHKSITKGTGESTFSPSNNITVAQFTTLLLRVLGYDDSAGDFKWDNPFELASNIGLLTYVSARNICYRKDMVQLCWNALHCKLVKKDYNNLLLDILVSDSVVSSDAYEDAKIIYKNTDMIITGEQSPIQKGVENNNGTSSDYSSIIGEAEYGEDF